MNVETIHHARGPDGQFARQGERPMPYLTAATIYNASLATVCQVKGLDVWKVLATLQKRGERNFEQDWRRAAYARQLAIYLANTSGSVKQRHLAAVAGLTPAAVCLALKDIEDLRDDPQYDAIVSQLEMHLQTISGKLHDR